MKIARQWLESGKLDHAAKAIERAVPLPNAIATREKLRKTERKEFIEGPTTGGTRPLRHSISLPSTT